MIRTLFIVLLVAFAPLVRAEDNLRAGTPKDCYLYSWAKGPRWMAKVSAEFHLALLNRQMPSIDDRYFEPTEKALTWIDRQTEPVITTVASVEGRKVIQVMYPEKGSSGKTIGMILLAIETARNSEWFAPFLGAQPEFYRGQCVSSRDVAFGYVATFELSGTGGFRSHYCFDLRKPHPEIVGKFEAGRVARNEFKSDAAYEEAIRIFDREADFLAGNLSSGKKP